MCNLPQHFIGKLTIPLLVFHTIILLVVLGIPLTSVAEDVDPSLVGWWKCDGSGTTAIDSSGNGFDIPLHNTTWEDGVFGGALHFHGVGYGHVENFKYSDNAITVCAWVRHDAFRIGKIERYVTVAPEVAVIRKEGDGQLHFYIKTDGNLRHLWVSDVLREGRWHHVAGTWDGLTQRLYIDGVEIASEARGGVLGNTSNVEMSSGGESFNGMLDEVRIYNRALTEPEILGAMEGLVEGWPYASKPAPADGAKFIEPNVRLSWTAGFSAKSHRLYFGDNFDHVEAGTGGTYKGSLATATYTPGPIEFERTYYWRVDEFDGSTRHIGDVWSFTTELADGGLLVKYGGGTGEADDPYLIYTGQQMNAIGLHEEDWDNHFKLMADIDLSGFTGTDFNIIGYYISDDDNKPFTGIFDGSGKKISNFSYSCTDINRIGLFGYVDDPNAEIKDLELIDPNVDAGTGDDVGSLVGYMDSGTIDGCYAQGGSVSGNEDVGGLVGLNKGLLNNCHSVGNVTGNFWVGGLLGVNGGTLDRCYSEGSVLGNLGVAGLVGYNVGTITDCYATGNVWGTQGVGGLVGYNDDGTITNCYANCYVTGGVSGNNWYFGGLVGSNFGTVSDCYAASSVSGELFVGGLVGRNDDKITRCYSVGSVTGRSRVGGLVGGNEEGTITDSFWDTQTSGQYKMCGNTGPEGSGCDNTNGKTTAEMQMASTYTNTGWDFVGQPDGPHDIWAEPLEGGYPILSWQLPNRSGLPTFSGGTGEPDEPYLISTAEDLNRIGHNPRLMEEHFKLIDDIDLSGIDFFIIGSELYPFGGVFDGNGKKISNFTYTSADEDFIGLFRYVEGATIKDLGLIDSNVNAGTGSDVGALVGSIGYGDIRDCHVRNGNVSGYSRVGGLAGNNYAANITDCYNEGTVSGEKIIGGLVGTNHAGTIENCSSVSTVNGVEMVGGLAGMNDFSQLQGFYQPGIIAKCYATGSITGQMCVGGLVGDNLGNITDSYSTADIAGFSRVGGLVGHNILWADENVVPPAISSCYASGSVFGMYMAGGLLGANEGGTVTNSFWDIETSGKITSDGGMGRTTSQMQMKSTFLEAGWDFMNETTNGSDDIWKIDEGQDYPRLWWQLEVAVVEQVSLPLHGESGEMILGLGTLEATVYSTDGKYIATAGSLGAFLWDAETGALLRTFRGRTDWVYFVAFSPDGKRVLTGSDDWTAKLWDAETGQEIRTFRGHMSIVFSAAFSPDGTRVLTGCLDETAKLWDAETGQEIRTFLGHTNNVYSVAFSPDGTRVLTGSYDETAKLWDAETGQEIHTFLGHTHRVSSVAFSPDGTRVLTGSWDSTAKLWDAETGQEIRTFLGHTNNVYSVAFSPDGRRVLTGSYDETAKLWDAETGQEIRTFLGHTRRVFSVAFSPDGTRVLTGSRDTTAKLWDVETGQEIRTFLGHTGQVYSVAFSPDGMRVLTGSLDWAAKLWDAETGQEIRTFFGHMWWVYSVAFSPDGTRVLTGSYDDTAKLWHAETGQEIRTFRGHADWVNSVAFSPDGTRVLTGSYDDTAKLWDVETGQEVRTFRGHTGNVLSVAFSPDGTRVLTGSWDSTAKLWDAETGQEIRTFLGHTNNVYSVAFSPDGTRVLTGGWDETAKLWDAETGQKIRTFLGHTSSVFSVAFSPAGTRVLTGGWDETAKLWDAETGQEIRTFSGHMLIVRSVAFSPDGTRVLTGSEDGTARIWDLLQPELPPPPKGRGCFLADTPVWVNGALVQISNVVSGQMVGGPHCDLATDCLEQIETVEEHEGTFECRDIVLESGNRISVVDAHCFMLDSGQWIAAQDLRSGLRLKTLSGTVGIKSVATRAVPFVGKVYNLKVIGVDRYLVSEDGVIVRDY